MDATSKKRNKVVYDAAAGHHEVPRPLPTATRGPPWPLDEEVSR